MKIAISIWPECDAEWIELSLSTLPGVSVELVGGRRILAEDAFDLLVVDADSPGPHFIQEQRLWMSQCTGKKRIPVIFLGDSSSPIAARLALKAMLASFVPKPYKINDLRSEVVHRLQAIETASITPISISRLESSTIHTTAVPASGRETLAHHPLNSLSSLRLSDLLQMLCLNQWTGKIEIIKYPNARHGCVYLNRGILIHAESPHRTAEEACYELLQWERCEFHFIEQHPPVVQTINEHWQMILVEAARLLDEDIAVAG